MYGNFEIDNFGIQIDFENKENLISIVIEEEIARINFTSIIYHSNNNHTRLNSFFDLTSVFVDRNGVFRLNGKKVTCDASDRKCFPKRISYKSYIKLILQSYIANWINIGFRQLSLSSSNNDLRLFNLNVNTEKYFDIFFFCLLQKLEFYKKNDDL